MGRKNETRALLKGPDITSTIEIAGLLLLKHLGVADSPEARATFTDSAGDEHSVVFIRAHQGPQYGAVSFVGNGNFQDQEARFEIAWNPLVAKGTMNIWQDHPLPAPV